MPLPIIMLNWNGLADTQECIAALEKQSHQDFKIYLVDNGSSGDEVAQLRSLYANHPKVVLQCNPDNRGFTRGNNQLLREILEWETPPPYVILLNNDTKPEPQWLSQLLVTAEEQQADMVASKMINYYDRARMDNAGHQLLNTLEVLPLGHDEPVSNYDSLIENLGPCAGAALYRVSMLQEIGLFDEYFTNGYEDVELGLRGIICGYRSVFAPAAVVYHKISRSINKIRDFEYTLGVQRNIYYIIAKLIPGPALIVCLPFLLFRTSAALLVNLLFRRWKFLRVQLRALKWVFTDGRAQLRMARRQFFQQYRTISSGQLLRRMDFFLKKDLERFYKYLIRKEKMVFEKYD